MMINYQTKCGSKRISSLVNRHGKNSHILIIPPQWPCPYRWHTNLFTPFVTMHHHIKFDYKRFCCSAYIMWMNIHWNIYTFAVTLTLNTGMHKTFWLIMHSCQPLLGVNLIPEFVNLYFLYAGRGLFVFHWWQRHFEFQLACVAVEGRSNVV